jgi:hypothetical protein
MSQLRTVLPFLMVDSGATNTVLAQKAGVSPTTIRRARQVFGFSQLNVRRANGSVYSMPGTRPAPDTLKGRLLTTFQSRDLSVKDARMLFPEANRQTIANALVYLAKAGLIQDSGARQPGRGPPAVIYRRSSGL